MIDISKSLVRQHREDTKGGEFMKTKKNDVIMQHKVFGWIALATGLILAIPLLSMQFTSDVDWDITDFTIMGMLLFGMGSIFVLVARVTPRKYRVLIGVGFALAVLSIWAELAVGIFTNLGS